MDAPCYRCADRKLGCHSECSKYRRYDEENKKNRKERAMFNITSAASRDRLDRHCKRKGRY